MAQFLAHPSGPEAPQTGPHQHHRGGGVEAQAREGRAVAGGPVVAVGGDQGHRIPQILDQVDLGPGPLGATGKAMKIDDGGQRRGSGWGGLRPGPLPMVRVASPSGLVKGVGLGRCAGRREDRVVGR